jgi:diazepam-binding inhibitor (GABA receptor modulator, acyl-CoA-binding protein)
MLADMTDQDYLEDVFDAAAAFVEAGGASEAKQETLLELYALFKQATDGDVSTAPPGILNVKAKAKWYAFHSERNENVANGCCDSAVQ